jgi:hypothetical protein
MKRFALAFGVLAFVLACSDATTAPTSQLAPSSHILSSGRIPPPPVDASIAVCTSDTGDCGTFDGTYFSNGATGASTLAAAELNDPTLSQFGTAWLRFAHDQPAGEAASANARVKHTDFNFQGNGFIQFADGVVVSLENVVDFISNPDCDTGEACAAILVRLDNGGQATILAFNKNDCPEGIRLPSEEGIGAFESPTCTFFNPFSE